MRTHLVMFLRGVPVAFLAALLILVLAGGLKASAQVVTNAADSGPGTLRSALTNAANGAVISFAPNLSGATITLASTLLVSTNLTIDASALTDGIQINGNGSVQIFNIASNYTVTLNSLTISNGYVNNGAGGGIANNGTLTVNNCTLSGNRTSSSGSNLAGGGIVNNGTLTLSNCMLSGNSATQLGGGICNFGTNDSLTVIQCTLSGNSGNLGGGGIFNYGTLTLSNCTLSGNSADGPFAADGGGIGNFEGTVVVNNCMLSGNIAGSAGGGVGNLGGTVTVNQSTLMTNICGGGASVGSGGGIFNSATMGEAGTVTVNQSTLSGNTAKGGDGNGGGVCNDPSFGGQCTMIVNQSTLSGNSASSGGGGVYNSGTLTLTNTIVASNSASSGGDIYNSISLTWGGSNLVQSVYNGGTITGPSPLTNAPDLAPLGNYGGPTQTMPPLPGSPAIGAGSVAANTFATDQRGYARTQNGLIDIGAVELPTVEPFTANPTNDWQPNPVLFTSTNVDSDGSAIVQWSWSFGDNQTSTAQNPTHAFAATGNFSPSLIVTNSLGLALAVSGPVVTVYPPLSITPGSVGITGSGASGFVQFAFSNVTGLSFSVLATNNITAPVSTWPVIGTATENPPGSGQYQFTDPNPATNSGEYYILRQP